MLYRLAELGDGWEFDKCDGVNGVVGGVLAGLLSKAVGRAAELSPVWSWMWAMWSDRDREGLGMLLWKLEPKVCC